VLSVHGFAPSITGVTYGGGETIQKAHCLQPYKDMTQPLQS